ncbi:glycosyltransferase family 90 protein [Rhodotorula graminis WP1]|uniref:Glycosyltransferase family 90 protein n=1 Tax=Rhodotorula graminis (strain WP1) TaxID=578459 RepID=A0A194S218_RHOGW|nr:glycosyltransferase family 90 protein [Rhodotorula graminis WP1]KPV74647.1 glycosyltransferase family 90 protein [Rhodotorula graminis WP1]
MVVAPLSTFAEPPKPHPIFTLIKRAEQDWNRKVHKQSKTLKDAVHEYRRRYKRNPPRGFDKWWAYAKANRVILVDEYDQIHRDLEPFWALEPQDLAHRVRVMQERDETFTIQVTDGKVAEVGEQAFLRRAKDLGDLIRRFSDYVPDVNLTFTRHDQPACQLDYYHRDRMVELAQLGECAGTDPGPLVPLFTFAKTNVHSDILVTPLEQYSDSYIGYDPDWDKKSNDKLMWRGSTTGIDFYVGNDWKNSQRARLHFKANEKDGKEDVLWAEGDGAVQETNYLVNGLNRAYMDVSFAGGPVQCDEPTCKVMADLIDFKETMGLSDAYQYKYVMDVDGNGWSGRFHRLMSMKACVLKSTLFPEWYGDRIQPWLHYVPVKVDYSDLYDIMTFFRGTPDGKGAHDELAKKIGTAGKHWARDHWRKQDMAAYMFRLSLEWARLLHRNDDEPGSLDFEFWID